MLSMNVKKTDQNSLSWDFGAIGAKDVLQLTERKSKFHVKVKNQNGVRLFSSTTRS